MKKRFIALTMLLSLLMVFSSVSSVFADADDGGKTRTPYKYTITIYSGNHGHFTDGSTEKRITVDAGTQVNLGNYKVELNDNSEDSQYYIRGFRETGHDNDEEKVVKQAFDADEDASYEVAYGIKGGMVKYTIMYVDENGDELQPSNEYYGMVGDKPVVSYLYIDGYQPNAYNLTKTLVADESQNIFGFSYISNPEGTTVVETTDGNNGQAGARNAANGQTAGANAAANDANANAPATIVDLDDNATPQAENAGGTSDIAETDTPKAGISPIAIGGGVAAVAAIAALAAFLIRRRNAEYEDDDEDEDKAYSSDSQHAYSQQE